MKYRVYLPKPSAKRLVNVQLIVNFYDAWGGDKQTITPMESDKMMAEFEVPDDYEWIYNTKILDGHTFSVEVEFSNSKGTRVQKKALVPEKIV